MQTLTAIIIALMVIALAVFVGLVWAAKKGQYGTLILWTHYTYDRCKGYLCAESAPAAIVSPGKKERVV